MKKVLLAGVAVATLFASGAAVAADLPSRHVQPAPVVVAPIFTWTGFYLGANAGYAWNHKGKNHAHVVNNVVVLDNHKNNKGGFTGGGQLGYNYQFGQFVAGLETDINYADLKHKHNHILGHANNGINWFGTVRGRLGVAFDQALVYATSGFAYGGGDHNGGYVFNGTYIPKKDNTRTGWTIGGGVEYALTNNVTARVEGLYVDLGKSRNHYAVENVVQSKKRKNEFGVVRAGLNYKFDSF